MDIIERFTNGLGTTNAAVIDFDGAFLLATIVQGKVRLSPWGPAYALDAFDNPGWDKLDELEDLGLIECVFEGDSLNADDRYEWCGEPIPGLEG